MADVDFGTPESAVWYKNVEAALRQLLDENAKLAEKSGVDLARPEPPPQPETPEQELARLRQELAAINSGQAAPVGPDKGVPSA